VPGRGKEAKLKVVICQYFKYRCQRKVMKRCEHEKSSKTHCWVYVTEEMKGKLITGILLPQKLQIFEALNEGKSDLQVVCVG